MSILIGVGLGLAIGIWPGGSSVLAVFAANTFGLSEPAVVVSAVVAFIVSQIQMAEPATPAGMLARLPAAQKAPKLIRQKVGYFALAFCLATPLYLLYITVLGMSPALAYLLLALGIASYVYGNDPAKRRRMDKHLRWLPFLQAGAVAITVLGLFALAKHFSIANPVYCVMLAIFTPWETIFGWERKRGPTRERVTDLDRRVNPIELFLTVPPFSLLSGWSSPMISAFGLAQPSEKEQLRRGPVTDPIKQILLTEAIGEGFRLGILVSDVAVGDFSGLSSITEPLMATTSPENHKTLIVLAVMVGCGIAYALANIGARIYSQFSEATKVISYGTLSGIVIANAGFYALPIIGLGIALAGVLNWVMVEESEFAFWDPNAPQRARSIAFAFPILFL